MNKIIAMFLCFIIVLPISCEQNQTNQSLNIGWIGPLSGDLAALGVPNLRGVELAIDAINNQGGIDGKPINLLIEDDEFDALKTQNAFVKLTDTQGIEAALTVSYNGFLVVAPLAEQKQVVMLDSLEASDELAQAGDWSFGIGIYDEGIGNRMAEFLATTLNKKKIGVLYFKDDPFFPLVVRGLTERFSELGGEIIAEGYSAQETDFRTMLSKMKDVEAIGALGVR